MTLVFASATRCETAEEFHKNTWLGRSIQKLAAISQHEIRVSLALNRKDGLPVFYNQVIDENPDADVIITAHDDLAILDLFFFEKLQLAVDEFDIVGLCGCRTPKDEAHVAWFSKEHGPSGMIGTSLKPSDEAVLSCNLISFGPSPARAAEMDGVFIAFDPKKIGDLRFDERFAYHHYDVDFTLTADKRGLKVATWPIFTVHISNDGDGYQSRSFRESAEVFTAKWSTKSYE